MVLQRDATVPIWGWADPGEVVTVSIAGQSKTATTDDQGKWTVKLDKLSAGESLTLTVQGKNTVTVEDVLVGEVWLASGQSNMAFPVSDANGAAAEMAAANFPRIRMFTVERHVSPTPQADCRGQWIVCSPKTVGNFSAVAFFFGRELHQKLNIPVGLVNASWGSTPIESWMSMSVQQDRSELDPVFKPWAAQIASYDEGKARTQFEKQRAVWKDNAEKAKAAGRKPSPAPKPPESPRMNKRYPANLFNSMIAPLIPYAIQGTIWYQGENNAQSEYPQLYATQLPLLIQDWRQRWHQGDFPFAWVQLPNFQPKKNGAPVLDGHWAVVREAMLHTLAMTNTGMAVAIDVGEAEAIHPKDKQTVGKRLALWAVAKVYGNNIPWSGPLPAGQQIIGDKITVSFTHTDGGLVAKGGELKGFAIAGADHQWVLATAVIQGDRVIVASPEVKSPAAVRYGWADDPDCNLYNGAGFPASPFRTDDW